MLKVIFFGSGQFAVPALLALHQADWCSLEAVVSQPDRPVGRQQRLSPTPVKLAAQRLGLPVYERLPELAADLGVVVSYGQILPVAVLQHFRYGVVNVHPSLLPRWRGPGPIRYALWHGDKQTGVTIILLDSGMDTGPILAQKTFSIADADTAELLEDALAEVGAELLITTIPNYCSGQLRPQPQSSVGVCYSKLVQRSAGEIVASDSTELIMNKFRAFQPWPGIYFMNHGKRFKILQLHRNGDELTIERIQPEGKQPLSWSEFRRGYPQVSFPHIR